MSTSASPTPASSSPGSFGTTLSSGIQDLSAILSLLGTEQCEVHVGSALRGGGRGGYLYAAVTPLSIFGSLGVAKAAFTIMLLGFPQRGAKILQQMGFDAKGDVLSLLMPEAEEKRYGAESRLLTLLQRHYLGPSAHKIQVERPPISGLHLPGIRPWNLWLLGTSALVACLGATPYLHFTVLHHTSFPALGIFFPICRVVGGLLCVFPGQLLLQYRIQMILRQRMLFAGINNLLNNEGWRIESLSEYIQWDERYASEVCLTSLRDFLQAPMDNALKDNIEPFLNVLARALRRNPVVGGPPTDAANADPPKATADAGAIAMQLEQAQRNTAARVVMQILLLMGFIMALVGYVGCFTIVQNAPNSTDTYIWLGAEAVLAFVRLLVWAANPSWDDSDGVLLIMDCSNRESLPVVESDKDLPHTFEVMSGRTFWETLEAYCGAVNIEDIRSVRGFRSWYSWIKKSDEAEMLSIILREEGTGGYTVMCTMKAPPDLQFHNAELTSDDGITITAKQTKRLDKNHPLMKSSEFRMVVFEHYISILALKHRVSRSSATQASWALSHSW